MELVTILLSTLLSILTPVGFVADEVAETTIRNQLEGAEELLVRIDNTPSYQILQGRVDRVRIAGRGLYPLEGLRIAVLELETDPIVISPDLSRLELKQPLQAAVKLVLTEADISQALQSELVSDSLTDLNLDFAGEDEEIEDAAAESYDVVNPQFEFLAADRFRFQATLQGQRTGEQTLVVAESGLNVTDGQQLHLVEPVVSLGDQSIEPRFLNLLVENVSQQALNQLEDSGVTARVLQLEITDDRLMLASFVRVEPEAASLLSLFRQAYPASTSVTQSATASQPKPFRTTVGSSSVRSRIVETRSLKGD